MITPEALDPDQDLGTDDNAAPRRSHPARPRRGPQAAGLPLLLVAVFLAVAAPSAQNARDDLQRAAVADQVHATALMATAGSDLVRTLQRERGLTAVYLTSGERDRGRGAPEPVRQARRDTDVAVAAWSAVTIGTSGSGDLDRARHLLARLEPERRSLDTPQGPRLTSTFAWYGTVVDAVVATVGLHHDPRVVATTQAQTAWFVAMLQAGEALARQRGLVAAEQAGERDPLRAAAVIEAQRTARTELLEVAQHIGTGGPGRQPGDAGGRHRQSPSGPPRTCRPGRSHRGGAGPARGLVRHLLGGDRRVRRTDRRGWA